MFKKINVLLLSIFLLLFVKTGYSDDLFTSPIIVKTDNGQVVVNQGFYENIGNSQIFTVKHGDKIIGKIKVKELYEHYCVCEPIDNTVITSISKGDSAIPEAKNTGNNKLSNTTTTNNNNKLNETTSKVEKQLSERELAQQKREEEKAIREAKKNEEKLKKEAEKAEKDRLAAIEERKQQIQDDYVEKLAGCTRTVSFHKKTGTSLLPNPQKLYQAYSLYKYADAMKYLNSSSYMGGHHLTTYRMMGVTLTLKNMIAGMKQDNQKAQKASVKKYGAEIEIIYMTPELMKSQALLLASGDDTYEDENQVNAIALGMVQQNELDSYSVFQVTITNNENSAEPLQLAPFKWKMVIITDTNEEIKAIKYDEALDKTLGPGQSATGNIYFPLTDSMGHKLTSHNLKIRLQSILDKKVDIKWSDSKGKPNTKTKGKVKSKKNKK